MNSGIYGDTYARLYDLLYKNKNYEVECDLLQEVFRRHGQGATNSVLDLGCGTGGHAIPLARRGYQVAGVDRSPKMAEIAGQKAEAMRWDAPLEKPHFLEADLLELDLGRAFDAVIMMFSVLGYQTSNQEVMSALATVRRHLRPGGLFVCDVWYGPAVLRIGPSNRIRVVAYGGGELIRSASPELDLRRHVCRVHYQLWRMEGERLAEHIHEEHNLRFFFPMELENILSLSGLELAGLYPFGDLGGLPSAETWNVLVCARAL